MGDRGTGGSADVMGESERGAERGLVRDVRTPFRLGPVALMDAPVTDFFSQSFVRLVAKSGLPAIRLHDLRHTHATFLKLSTVAADASFDRVNNSGSARKAALLASA